MKQIPKSVDEHISNARYYLSAADKHPAPTQNAVLILLLLVAWENIVLADHDLSSWASETNTSPEMRKSHSAKLQKLPAVTRIILDPKGSPSKEITFSTGHDFEELRKACQYGSNTESKDVQQIFKSGWHLDGLRNGLINKIEWTEMMLEIYRKELLTTSE
jgi:hypothetical protein